MNVSAKRRSGLVLFIIGLIIAVGAYFLSSTQPHDVTKNGYEIVAIIVGASLALSGLVVMVSPKGLLVSDRDRIIYLEKRVAQLERERKNTP